MATRNKPNIKPREKLLPRDISDILKQIKGMNFWLCVQFADTLIRYIEITMKQDSVTSRLQGWALYFLVINGGESTPTRLSKDLLRSKHSVTKIIDSLEKEGMVVRDFSSKDRRVTSIRLTEAGLEHLRKRFDLGNERAKSVMGSLGDKDQQRLVELTEKMRQKMTEILESY